MFCISPSENPTPVEGRVKFYLDARKQECSLMRLKKIEEMGSYGIVSLI